MNDSRVGDDFKGKSLGKADFYWEVVANIFDSYSLERCRLDGDFSEVKRNRVDFDKWVDACHLQ